MKTDQQIQEDIRTELRWDPAVLAEHVGVDVKDGVVSLSGQVDSFAEKWAAVRAAQRVSGVHALATALTVRLKGHCCRSDAEIAAAAANILSWHSSLHDSEIEVRVQGGWVTLTGHVRWQYQRESALECVRALMGVTGIVDKISLRPGQEVVLTAETVEEALLRMAHLTPGQVHVSVEGGTVTLQGKVSHWAERQSALTAAWAVAGVRHVHDALELKV